MKNHKANEKSDAGNAPAHAITLPMSQVAPENAEASWKREKKSNTQYIPTDEERN